MNKIVLKLYKGLFRIWRILLFHKGVYGKYGKGNIFKKNVLINENSIIGNYNYFGEHVSVTAAKIGNYCSIAPNVTIGPGEHDVSNVSTCVRAMEKAGVHMDLEKGECVVGNDVWIGANVVVLRNVKIGDGAVLAAGAIVNKDVPPYAIVGGVPAKIIKYRFDPESIKQIRWSRWYLKNIDLASADIRKLQTLIKQYENYSKTMHKN